MVSVNVTKDEFVLDTERNWSDLTMEIKHILPKLQRMSDMNEVVMQCIMVL